MACVFAGSAGASEAICETALSRVEAMPATPATSDPRRTRIPAVIAVEQAGFTTQDAAAKCFGQRYHTLRKAEYITVIVAIGGGWGYLTPGKGTNNARQLHVRLLLDAYRAAGFRPMALAHTHPYGRLHFSAEDLHAVAVGRAPLYLTNWRNETYRVDPALLDAKIDTHPASSSAIRRLAGRTGFPADRID